MSANEIARLMEINKKKAELEFRKGYLISRNKVNGKLEAMETEIAEITKQSMELESRITAKGITLFYPNSKNIAALNMEMASLGNESLYLAMEKRAGDDYAKMEKKGIIVKQNMENRWEIAFLIVFVNSLPSEVREIVVQKVESGEINEMDVSILNNEQKNRLFRLLNRAGLRCILGEYNLTGSGNGLIWDETYVESNGRKIWVNPAQIEETKKFEAELREAGRAIQVTNAERQVKSFSIQEEEAFMELQKRFVEMVRRKEQMLNS